MMPFFKFKKRPSGDPKVPASLPKNPYDEGWSAYSDQWETAVKSEEMKYLGDEWGSGELTEGIIQEFVIPFLVPDGTALEIGCGGGKYSEWLAHLHRKLVCTDVSEKMVQRTKARLSHKDNVSYEVLNGYDLGQFADSSFDYVFSFDVFVHIDMEDAYSYVQEIHRVLKDAGRGLLHFANLSSSDGWKKFVAEVPINRGGGKNFDRFRFLTWEIVEKFLKSLDFNILKHKKEPWRDIIVVFEK